MEKLFLVAILLAFAMIPHIISIPFDERDLETDEKVWDLYERWQRHHSVHRDHQEKHKRFGVFKGNAKYIHEFNKKANKHYKLALNKFGDLSKEEFMSGYAGARVQEHRMFRSHRNTGEFMYSGVNVKDLPTSVDWRTKGAVNNVKDQGKCGSCWAFSTVASVEGINQIKTGSLVSLSEQELVDCESDNSGCNGGLMENAFEFIKSSGGITTETDYPYRAANGTCDAKKLNSPVVVIDGHENVPLNSEDDLMKAVANQPVSVAMDASSKAFQFYSEGVFTGDCNTELNHGVVVVGYGEDSDDSGVKYWIVRNSWGADWGEQGYIRMQRNVEAKEGLCGIAMDASYPVKTSPNPSKKRRNTNRRQLNWVGPESS